MTSEAKGVKSFSSTCDISAADKADVDDVHVCPDNLRILICTGNLGNAAPTKESFAALLPAEGSVDEVLSEAKYPLPLDINPEDSGGSFDIIVVGMQEAVFTVKDEKKGANHDRASPAETLSAIAEEISLSNLKLASMRGLFRKEGSDEDSVMSDDSIMSIAEPLYDATERRVKRSNLIEKLSSRDGPMPSPKTLKDSPSQVISDTVTKATKTISGAITKTGDGVATAAKNVVNPVATGIVSVAGDVDHNRGTAEGKAIGIFTGGPNDWVGGTKELYELATERLGDDYYPLVRYQRGEMRLAILVRNKLRPLITDVKTLAENTGIAGVVANKGGIISTLTLGGITRLSFLTAHLEAHEGKEHYINRCSNLAEILGGAKKGALDSSLTSHHMFAMGDLNFRVQLPPPEGKEKWEGIVHRSKVRDIVGAGDWATLNESDELQSALKNGDCLAGFTTLPCNFHPTFKVERQVGFHYQEKRTPSYTDRILWKSAHGLKDDVRPLFYEPVSNYATSDHKPVRGVYSVVMKNKDRFVVSNNDENVDLSPAFRGPARNLHLFVSDIALQKIPKTWEARKNQPYVLFVADPKDLIREKRSKRQIVSDKIGLGGMFEGFSKSTTQVRDGYFRTRVNKKDGENPSWGDCEVHLQVRDTRIRCSEDLAGSFLYLNVYDKRGFSVDEDDYLIGSVALNLQELSAENGGDDSESDGGVQSPDSLLSAKKNFSNGNAAPIFDVIDIDEPILKNGKEKGRLLCTVTTWWLEPEQEGRNLSQRKSTLKKNAWWRFGKK